MYKDGDYRGLSLEEVILAIHDELRENRAFLQMSLLDPDPDNRPAEDLRIRKIMELAGVMENVLDTLVRDTCGSEEGGVDVEYRNHTPVKPDESENIEQDWNMDAVGDEAEDVKKKKDKTKKGKKNKKDKKGKKKGKKK